MGCPRDPKTKRYSPSICELCRATTGHGYNLRRMLVREARFFKEKLDFHRHGDSRYNFICPHFPWNLRRFAVDSSTQEEISLEGAEPLQAKDCEYHSVGKCSKYKVPLPFIFDIENDKLVLGSEVLICELCLAGGEYLDLLERFFNRVKFLPK